MEGEHGSEARQYCIACGVELPAGSRFCPGCGKATDVEGLAEEATVQVAVPAIRSRRAIWIVAGVVAVLIVAGVAAGSIVMAQNRAAAAREAASAAHAAASAAERKERAQELRRVYEAVAAVDSAVSVGINFGAYSGKVQDAQAALDAYTPKDEQASAVVANLRQAVSYYAEASSEWNSAIQSSYRSVDEGKLQAMWSNVGALVVKARAKLEAYEAE